MKLCRDKHSTKALIKAMGTLYDVIDNAEKVPSNSQLLSAMYNLNCIVKEMASHLSGKAIAEDPEISKILLTANKWDHIGFMYDTNMSFSFTDSDVDNLTLEQIRTKTPEKLGLKEKENSILEEIDKMFKEGV
jgi:hypothetical protein